MAGHSKWKQIKHKKAATDKKRSAVFTKLIREITVAAKMGGTGDPASNPRLRLAIDTAKAASMPAENITRAILKGTGELEGVNYQDIIYEAYGPGGVALLVETLTDNGNRTVAEVRHALDRHSGNMGAANSVAWQFERKGILSIDSEKYDEGVVFEAALEAGAEDVQAAEDHFSVTSAPADFMGVQDGLRAKGIVFSGAELTFTPTNVVTVGGGDAVKLMTLIDALEELDDVQKVHGNFELDEAALAAME